MTLRRVHVAWAAALLLSGCDRPPPLGPEVSNSVLLSAHHGDDPVRSATGHGVFLLGGTLPTKFHLRATERANGKVKGHFRHHTEDEGFVYDFRADVTCLAVDAENHRAWIGGVITRNRSTDPAFQQVIHQPGHDIWFRVLDNGEGPDVIDRMTFVGFEGTAGIQTSAEYCERRLWLNNGQPVTNGGIQVRP